MNNELDRLRTENQRLRRILHQHGIPIPSEVDGATQIQESFSAAPLGPQDKIRLFRSLFRGREDVYAVRWEAPDGRTGYSPKSERDWKAYYATKPEERHRVDKETRKYFPISD